MKLPNRYASQTERLHATAWLPKSLIKQVSEQARLQALIAPLITIAKDSYQVVGYRQGVLTISTQHTSALAHLSYQKQGLLQALQRVPTFNDLHTIHVVAIGNK